MVEEASIISREEARSWLVREGLFDEEDLMTIDDDGRATDTEAAKGWAVDMGPKVRAYSNGRTMHLEKRRRAWQLDNSLLKTVHQNYAAGLIAPDALGEMLALAVEVGV